MVAPSVRRTDTGFWVGQMLSMGQFIMTYVPVAPDLSKAEWGCLMG